jgi:hypothetical protein
VPSTAAAGGECLSAWACAEKVHHAARQAIRAARPGQALATLMIGCAVRWGIVFTRRAADV